MKEEIENIELKTSEERGTLAAFQIDKDAKKVESLADFHIYDNGQRVYTPANKPSAKDINAVAVGQFGVGCKQGAGADGKDYTEDKTLDFNKLVTAGEYSISGNWLNGINNVPTATSHTGICKVEVRHWSAGPAYVQTFTWAASESVARKVRYGTGAYPNVTWHPWKAHGSYELHSEYRVTLDRPGATVYPYLTMNKRDLRTDATGNYVVGAMQFKVDATDGNNPDTGKLAASVVAELDKDNAQGQLVLKSRSVTNNADTTWLRLSHEGMLVRNGGKDLGYKDGVLTVVGKKVFHAGNKAEVIVAEHIEKSIDLNDYTTTGFYNMYRGANNTFTNAPSDFTYGTLEVIGRGAAGKSFVTQILTWKESGRQMIRTRNDGSFAWQPWRKIYSEAQKPTATDVGAVSKTGDTMSGQLVVRNGDVSHRIVHSGTTAFYQGGASTGDTGHNMAFSGYNGKSLAVMRFYMENNRAPVVRWGSTDHAIFHAGNKPTAADVGAVNKNGDTMTGNLNMSDAARINFTGINTGTYIQTGKGDGASQDTTNLQIRTWQGLGISPSAGNDALVPDAKNSIWMNARNGNIYTIGELYAQTDKKVFHTGSDVKLGKDKAIIFPTDTYAQGAKIYSQDKNQYGCDLIIRSGGNVVYGSGESPDALAADLKAGTITGDENTYITSDHDIRLFSGANAWDNRKTTTITGDGTLTTSNAQVVKIGDRSLRMGVGTADMFLHNSASNKYLQLRDNGNLDYGSKTVFVDGDPRINGSMISRSKALSSEDLDTLKTAGVYHQSANANATNERHYPVNLAGSLVVYLAAGIIQEYRVYNRAETWTRAQYSSGAWTTWAKTYNTLVKPTAADVGLGNVVNKGWNTGAVADTYAVRDGSADIQARLFRSTYSNETRIDGAIAFRINNSSDNYTRFCSSPSAVRNWVGAAPSGYGLGEYGKSISTILGDNDLRRTSGFFQGSNIQGLPTDGHSWKYVFSQAHGNATGYFGYLAIDFAGSKAWIGAQEGGTQKGPYELVKRGDNIVAGGRIEIKTGVNPMLEWHIPGKHAVCQYLDGSGNFRLVTSNGVGGEVSLRAQFDVAGGLYVVQNGNFNDVHIRSDKRLKSDLVKVDGALEKVAQLTAYSYDKHKSLTNNEVIAREVGLIAQDLREVLPEAVNEAEDTTLTISNSAVNALLVEAIKELKAEIEELKRGMGK